MANQGNIALNLKGPAGVASLSDFSVLCMTLRTCLKNVSRCVTGSEDIEYEVTDLRRSSAFVQVSPLANGVPSNSLWEVSEVFVDTITAIQDGRPIDSRLDYRAVCAFNGFSGIAKKNDSLLEIGGQRLTSQFSHHLADLLHADDPTHGSVTGRLESFTIHNDSKFTLYPPVAGEEVDCVFVRDDLEKVLRAVDHSVTVYGTLYYAKTKSFPVRVEVESWEILPDLDALPTLLDSRGSLGSDVREIGDDWMELT